MAKLRQETMDRLQGFIDSDKFQTLKPETQQRLTSAVGQEPEQPRAKPLSFLERGKFAFGDEPGRRSFLEKRFPGEEVSQLPTGKFAVSGEPVDPEGFDIGDFADIADELVRFGAQLKGAAFGAAKGAGTALAAGQLGPQAATPEEIATVPIGGIIGGILGGGAARAAGQTAVEAIGRGFGVREQEVPDLLKDIAAEGAFGLVGEAAGALLKPVSNAGVKFTRNMFNRMSKKVTQPTVQNIFNFTAGIEKNSIARVQQRGAKDILTRENMSPKALLKLGQNVQEGIVKSRKILGQQIGRIQNKLKMDTTAQVPINNIRKEFMGELRAMELLDDSFRVNKPSIKLTQETRTLLKVRKALLDLTKKPVKKLRDIGILDAKGNPIQVVTGVESIPGAPTFTSKMINARKAILLKNELDDLVKFAREGKLSVGTNGERIIKQLSNRLGEGINRLSPELRATKTQFSELAKLQDSLGTKLDLPRAERFLKNVLNDKSDEFSREVLENLEKSLPRGNKFLEKLKDVVAARDFASGTFRAIKSRSFTNVLGGAAAGSAVGHPVLGALGGVAVSTPRLVGQLLKGQQAVGGGLQAASAFAGRNLGPTIPPALAAILSRRNQGR